MSLPRVDAPPALPTVRATGSEKWQNVAADLRSTPGEWVEIEKDWWQSLANHINSGKIVAFKPAGAYEARAVRPDGVKGTQRAAIYARFVGTEGAETALVGDITPGDLIVAVRHAFRKYIEPARTGDHAALRNGVGLFDAAIRFIEKEVTQ